MSRGIYYIAVALICEDGDETTFRSVQQRDLFIRLHKKKCPQCKNWDFVNTSVKSGRAKTRDLRKELRDDTDKDNKLLTDLNLLYDK